MASDLFENSRARIDSAAAKHAEFVMEAERFVYRYVKGMIKGFDPRNPDRFVLQCRKPEDSRMTDRPRVLATEIVESVRSALDYVVYALSERNQQGINPKHPKFAIADEEDVFEAQAKVALRHLGESERAFVKALQPFSMNNEILSVIRDAANKGKHRELLKVVDNSSLEIAFGEIGKRGEYEGWWCYPQKKGAAAYARGELQVVMLGRYEAAGLLQGMVQAGSMVVGAFERYEATGARSRDPGQREGTDDGARAGADRAGKAMNAGRQTGDGESPLWYESQAEGRSWGWLWSPYERCVCGGIRASGAACPACDALPREPEWLVMHDADGNEVRIPPAVAGAEGRYEDWVYLEMLEREWQRPVEADLYEPIPEDSRPSARAIVVLVFWTYFETRIERLYRETAVGVPRKVMEHLLERHGAVGRRMKGLYKVVYGTTYLGDLNQLGYGKVAQLLSRVGQARNRFVHGQPEAIDERLVEDLVACLKEEHEGWIAVFNRRLRDGRIRVG